MAATDGVEWELVDGVPEKAVEADGLGLNMNKENEIDDSGSDVQQANGASLDPLKFEGLGSSGAVEQHVAAVVVNKTSNPSKNTKVVTKDGGGRNSEGVISRNPRVALSKSLSFPAKGAPISNLRKSTTFIKQKKTDVKNSGPNASEVASSVKNGGPPAKQSNSSTLALTRRSLHVKSGSVDATVNSTSSEAALSTTPRATAQQKNSASSFAFRLDERAEKRKEFFMKLEEKTHAKEVEKTSLQAKSKENQEAEIRQLRKSLTFKATPMPNFYQEPGPPKVELKKIPPTRPKSPKLGRHKPSAAAAERLSEGNALGRTLQPSPNPSKLIGGAAANGKVDSTATKKPTQGTLSKLPSQKATSTKTDAKPIGSKAKTSNLKQKIEKSEMVSNDKPTKDSPVTGAKVGGINSLNTAEAGATILDITDSITAPNEVIDPGIASNEALNPGNGPSEVLVEG